MIAEFTSISRLPVSDALVSVVLPVYNESAVLVKLCERLRTALTECRTTFEIIFVDDGSRDGSTALLDRLARQFADVRVIHLSRNFGQQAAIHAGLIHARGDAVVIMGANLQDPPEAIGQLLDAWQAGNDVVYAVSAEQQSIWKRALCSADSRTFGLIDARVLQIILALGKQNCTLPELRTWVGFKQFGVLVDDGPHDDDLPRATLRQRIGVAKKAINSAATVPLAIFAWLGLAALAVLFVACGYALYCKQFTDTPVPGWISQIANVSFFAALNALGISVLGNVLVRIHDQVRDRPMYLIDRTVNCAATPNQNGEQARTDGQGGVMPARADALDLEKLDPLEIDDNWDDAYRHLLDHAQGLLELGSLVRSEADDLADCESRSAAGADEVCDPEPQVIKLADVPAQR